MVCKSGKALQPCIDRLEHYTETCNLSVNVDKSKVLVFTEKRTPKLSITISGKVLEQVEEFIYLGVKFNKTGNLAKTSEYMRIKAQKALFSLTRSLIYKPIPISTMLKIFDKNMMPILVYGSDVWGTLSLKSKDIYSGNQILVPEKANLSLEVEKLCLKFFKQLIRVHRSTTGIAVLSELGRFPCQIICIIIIIKYWHRILLMDKDSLLYNTYKSQLEIIEGNNNGHHLWLHSVREILKLCKLETIFYDPTNFHTYRIINRIRDVLQKRFISFWGTVLTSEETISGKAERNKLRFYRTFKSHF